MKDNVRVIGCDEGFQGGGLVRGQEDQRMTGSHGRQVTHQRVNIVTGRQRHQATFATQSPAHLLNTVGQFLVRQDPTAVGYGNPVTVVREVCSKRQALEVKVGAHHMWS